MPQSIFGTGSMWATPAGATPTPTVFGAVQDVGLDFSFDLKQLWGSNQFPIEQARGKGKIDIKASVGRVDGNLFNNIFFGQTVTPNTETIAAKNEAHTVPGSPAYTVTVTNSATFTKDLGVYNTTTKLWMVRVASVSATNQYSVSAGVYTFYSANASAAVQISYEYTAATTGAATLAFQNVAMGSNVIFGLDLSETFVGQDGVSRTFTISFPAVQAPKLSMPLKLDDFEMTSIDMTAQDNGSGTIFTYSFTD